MSTEKLQTTEIKNVHIFNSGKWNGVDITNDNLDTMINNFKEKVIEPYVKIGHDEKHPLGELALGFVNNLYRDGNKLIADFKQVPSKIAQLIEAGALKKKSVEFFKTYKDASGKAWDNVLRAVAFFGANGEPAVNNLEDFVHLYKHDNNCDGQLIVMQSKEYNIMEIEKSEYDELLSFKVEAQKIGELSQTVEKMKSELESKDAELVTMKADYEKTSAELATMKAKLDDERKTAIETEAKNYIEDQVSKFKIAPKYKDIYVVDYITKRACGEENLKMFKDDIESRPTVVSTEKKDVDLNIPENMKSHDAINSAIEAFMA
jgi:hypothetical protein